MVTIFTEDGRTLQYDDHEAVQVLRWGRHDQLIYATSAAAMAVQQCDNIQVKGLGARTDRDIDIAFVREICKPHIPSDYWRHPSAKAPQHDQ